MGSWGDEVGGLKKKLSSDQCGRFRQFGPIFGKSGLGQVRVRVLCFVQAYGQYALKLKARYKP